MKKCCVYVCVCLYVCVCVCVYVCVYAYVRVYVNESSMTYTVLQHSIVFHAIFIITVIYIYTHMYICLNNWYVWRNITGVKVDPKKRGQIMRSVNQSVLLFKVRETKMIEMKPMTDLVWTRQAGKASSIELFLKDHIRYRHFCRPWKLHVRCNVPTRPPSEATGIAITDIFGL